MPVPITTHFTVEELTRTDTGLPNEPPVSVASALMRLCVDLLEPVRDLLGRPLVVHSGYRSPEVNARVKGDGKSAHLDGRACDFHPAGLNPRQAFDQIIDSGILYDKIILEHRDGAYWIHVQVPKAGARPRHLAYIAIPVDGRMVYHEVGH